MIARWIDLCARNSFLVFTGTLLLVLAGIWAERRMPLDALPDRRAGDHSYGVE
jgi:copper/silver efflux system protein